MTIIYENPLKQINLEGVYHKLKYHDFNYDKEIIDTQFKDFFEISQIIHNLHIDEHHKSNVILENEYCEDYLKEINTAIDASIIDDDIYTNLISYLDGTYDISLKDTLSYLKILQNRVDYLSHILQAYKCEKSVYNVHDLLNYYKIL